MSSSGVAPQAPRRTVGEALAASPLERREAARLLRHVLEVDAARLIAHPERVLTEAEARAFAAAAQRRQAGEPVAYILGRREFYGLLLEVSPAVLIPRPETELLVDTALGLVPADRPSRVLELGAGSGAVAIALARHRPQAQVVAVERSLAALEVARRNVRRLQPDNVRLVQGDWYDAVAGEVFDLIVSNPPYVATEDPHLRQGDVRFEPAEALLGGADGLEALRSVIAGAPDHLVAGGHLLMEHGWDQAPAVAGLLAAAGFQARQCHHDLAGCPRVSGGRVEANA